MSSDYFVKVKEAEGESDKKGHTGEIEISSWSWGLANMSSAGSGGGSGAGKAVPQDLHFTADMSKATPNLIKVNAKGTHLVDLKLTARKSADGQEDYMVITLSDVFVTSVTLGGSSGGGVSTTVSCAFKKFKIEYKFQDAKGALKAGPEFTWDISKSEFA
ncbi:type VI secretion system tube protein Hcp [soil metagenome]|jgi:type VI secretion system secreted protein Hcp